MTQTTTTPEQSHFQKLSQIDLPHSCLSTMLSHCRRKLLGNHLPGEDNSKKAFGLLAGSKGSNFFSVSNCFPLARNARQTEAYRDDMDQIMDRYAFPSETPMSDRGWIAPPEELSKVLLDCRDNNWLLIGTYHMHRVAWPHDQLRDMPTVLDTILGKETRLVMFIISMVNPDNPLVRAFYEGDPLAEIPIHYI